MTASRSAFFALQLGLIATLLAMIILDRPVYELIVPPAVATIAGLARALRGMRRTLKDQSVTLVLGATTAEQGRHVVGVAITTKEPSGEIKVMHYLADQAGEATAETKTGPPVRPPRKKTVTLRRKADTAVLNALADAVDGSRTKETP